MGELAGKLLGFVVAHPNESQAYAKAFGGTMLGVDDPTSTDWTPILKGLGIGAAAGLIVGVVLCNKYPRLLAFGESK